MTTTIERTPTTRRPRRPPRSPIGVMVMVLVGAVFVIGLTTVSVMVTDDRPGTSTLPSTTAPAPAGHQRSEAGAVNAATEFQVIIGSNVMFDSTARRRAISDMAAPGARERLVAGFDRYIESIEAGLGIPPGSIATANPSTRLVPLGYGVLGYSDDEATVAIWTLTISRIANIPPRAGWGTATVALRWTDDGWKLADTRSAPGPTPAPDVNAPSAPVTFEAEVAAFEPYEIGA